MDTRHQVAEKNKPFCKRFIFSNLSKPEKVVHLATGQGWGVKGKRGRQTLYCLEGTVWVTQQGDMRDYLLKEGDAFVVSRPGLVMARAMTPASLGYAENFMTDTWN
ncbi:DUF2917 domain-containing protein [uncultured Desulfosarcina sp.]|uniref:DUF2917 domain-containing protein n=1 Tax=uncultured Desulfosarcina sp. TaxID=218289 RepID=UPI0029C7E281|nr:DUF2917 domain-containing protein [uncultured Desulfosarcina sp.]